MEVGGGIRTLDPSPVRALVPPFTSAHERLRAEIRQFIATRLRPHADDWEAAGWFPSEAFQWLAQAGYLGLKFPAAYGGRDDPVAAAVLVEELARCGSGGVAAGLGAHAGIALPPILSFGTEEQRRRHLIPGLRGEKIAALAITEPGAGSDVASIRTHARPASDGYIVNGSKTYITGGVRADLLVTAVRTRPLGGQPDDPFAAPSSEAGRRARGRHEGISFLLIERRAGDGITTSSLRKLGWHASDTAEIAFEDVFVPAEGLLGAEHQGFRLIMANFQWERLLMALGALGAMQVCFEQTVDFIKRSPRAHGQAVRHRLAEVAVEIEAGRAVTYSALRRHIAGLDAVREVTIAKLKTQRSAVQAIDTCLALHGLEAPPELERALRDARLGPIGGGTDEIMKEILGRSLGL